MLKTWTDYYEHRKLPLSSPVAVVLSIPLTLYYVLTQIVQNHKRIKNKKHLELFILNPTKQLDQLVVFEELAHLIPNVTFSFTFVGPSVPSDMEYKPQNSRCKFNFRRENFHEIAKLPQQPDLAYAPNAGLDLNEEIWKLNLMRLVQQKIPSIFTEETETSTLNSTRMFAANGGHEGFQMHINPFRSPVWKEANSHAMPFYDYGFIQGINM